MKYSVVLKEKLVEDGLTKRDIEDMLSMFGDEKVIPVEIEGYNSTAMGFFSLSFSDALGYDYDRFRGYIQGILNDMRNESLDGNYVFHTAFGDADICLTR